MMREKTTNSTGARGQGKERLADGKLRRSPWISFAVCAFLSAIVWAVFGQTRHYEFVNFDDDVYVYQNPVVASGLTLQNVESSICHVPPGNWDWVPLTTLSNMVDYQLFGLKAGAYHLTNVFLHLLTACLLFQMLRSLTGAIWASAFVAAAFAVHPLRVESVAWVAERKDVLSGLFFMLTVWSYAGYVRRSGAIFFYLMALACLALGLMAKGTLVSVPLILLLLDYWPLNRVAGREHATAPLGRIWFKLLLEKIPFAVLAGLDAAATILAQRAQSSLQPPVAVTLMARVANGVGSYVIYLRQMLWPANLAVLYHHPGNHINIVQAAGAALILIIITVVVILGRRKLPFLMVGWLWYLIMLLPVLGIMQVGSQPKADRYTYLPLIGLYIAMTWGIAKVFDAWPWKAWRLGALAAGSMAAMMAVSWHQTTFWQNSESLWKHDLACGQETSIAHNNLGLALASEGKWGQAAEQHMRALEITPNFPNAENNLGIALENEGRPAEAVGHYERALRLKPNYFEAQNNLGNALADLGKMDEAIAHYRLALQLKPNAVDAHNNLGIALAAEGKTDEAIEHYKIALRFKSDTPEALFNLGLALAAQGKSAEALDNFRKALNCAVAQKTLFVNTIRQQLEAYQLGLSRQRQP
jgi:tetratricopeptide (TPR) repeat protein